MTMPKCKEGRYFELSDVTLRAPFERIGEFVLIRSHRRSELGEDSEQNLLCCLQQVELGQA
jgi:hypothetical protein